MNGAEKTPGAAATASEGINKASELSRQNSSRTPTRQQAWRKRNPKSYLAHLLVRNALRIGVLEKQPCAVCGALKVDAHHEDYDKPYDVVWLCRKHHRSLHLAEGGAA